MYMHLNVIIKTKQKKKKRKKNTTVTSSSSYTEFRTSARAGTHTTFCTNTTLHAVAAFYACTALCTNTTQRTDTSICSVSDPALDTSSVT